MQNCIKIENSQHSSYELGHTIKCGSSDNMGVWKSISKLFWNENIKPSASLEWPKFLPSKPVTEGFLIYAAFGCKTSKSENCQNSSYELGHKFECGPPGDMGDWKSISKLFWNENIKPSTSLEWHNS